MKSWLAINPDRRSTSSSRNGRKVKREVSRTAIGTNKDESRVSYDLLRKDADKNRGIRATSYAARFVEPVDRARGGGALHGLSFVQARNPDCFWRRSKKASMMLVGEQPGDYEDVAGKPFVGPAGKIMDRALKEAGIDRSKVYVTNAVKHFKWEPRGKRRIHQKPNSREIAACRPWLEAELQLVRPKVLICLGATAAQSIFGPAFRVTRDRGKALESEI